MTNDKQRDARARMSFRDIIRGVPATGPAIDVTNVTPMKSWDELHRAITRATNLLVAATAEEHRAKEAHDQSLINVGLAERELDKARAEWIERTRVLLAIDISEELDVEEESKG